MSVSYTVGGKSQTRQRGKKEENSAVSTPLNRGKRQPANLTAFHRTSNVNAARDQPVGGAGALRRPQKTVPISSGAKSEPSKIKTQGNLAQSERQSNIVTLSDLKASGEKKEGKHLMRKTPTNIQQPATVNGVGKNLDLVNNSSSSSKASSASVSSVSGRKLGHPSPEKESNASRTPVNRKSTGGARTLAHEYASLGSPNLEIRNSKSNLHQPQPLAKIQRTPTNKVLKGRGANSNTNNISTATATLKQSPQSKKSRVGKMASPGQGQGQGHGQDESDPSLQGQASPQQQQQQAGSAQHDGSAGFTRIAPNQGKRDKLTSVASKELAEFEKRKEARRSIKIEGPAQTTGGRKSEEDARLEMERQNRTKKYEQRMKKERYQREKREREDKELEEKKAKAREQTKKNAQMRAEREASFLRNDHQRTNEDFLRRVETGNRSPSASSSSTSYELQMLIEMFPQKEPVKLQKMLDLTDGDVDKVIDLLK